MDYVRGLFARDYLETFLMLAEARRSVAQIPDYGDRKFQATKVANILPDLPPDWKFCEWLVCLTQLCSNQSFMAPPSPNPVKITLSQRSEVIMVLKYLPTL